MTKASENPINPYLRNIKGVEVDAYDIIRAYEITCPAQQHALKKLLGRGTGEKSRLEELREIKQSIERAMAFEVFEEFSKQLHAPASEERQVCRWIKCVTPGWAECPHALEGVESTTTSPVPETCPVCGKPVRIEG